jgi:hypothetical protein
VGLASRFLVEENEKSWWKTALKLGWKHRHQIAGLAAHFLAQKDQIMAEYPDIDPSLFEIDPETATLEELNSWWSSVAKKAAKLGWKHRHQIIGLASHFLS